MPRHFTIQDIKNSAVAHLNEHLFTEQQPVKQKTKYGNKKVEIDGHVFDSISESRRYLELRALQTAGEIRDLQMQVSFPISTGKYIADFTYYTVCGKYIVEDVKGFKTKEYKMKKILMAKELGIVINEINKKR